MTKFLDGPAAGQVLMLKRAPLCLRVVRSPSGEWDALDQLEDAPKPREEIFAYVRTAHRGTVHIRSAKRGASGFYELAEYSAFADQPADEVMRETATWRAWCLDRAGKKEAAGQ